uniref:Secreted protein n=1 Tax=Meloidogyne hapla TaxID=6305 RepID=A0A1I8BKQ2_MELHA
MKNLLVAMLSLSAPTSADSSTLADLSPKKGITLAELIEYVEGFTRHKVNSIISGDTKHQLAIYRQNSPTGKRGISELVVW